MKNHLLIFLLFFSIHAFAQESDASMLSKSNVIKNATIPASNTPLRVGTMTEALVKNKVNIAYGVTATGTNVYAATIASTVTSYVEGTFVLIKFPNKNTGASTLSLNGLTTKAIVKKVLDTSTAISEGDIQTNQYLLLVYDGTSFQIVGGGSGGGGDVFENDVTFVLQSGDTFGKYSNGDVAEWEGLTAVEAILDASIAYIPPVWNSFAVTGQASTVEVGTTFSGSKTFTWSISANSGVVTLINISDLTASSSIITNTPNDGSQSVTVTTHQLNSNGSTQQWQGNGIDDTPPAFFNSSVVTVTARYYRFFGPASASPTNSATVRALSSSAFHSGATSFNLTTGTTLTKFVCALPPGVTISSVVDLDALNAVITSEYILTGTISVTDAGGTSRTYNIYEMNIGVPYSSTHRHQITTAN